MHFAHDAGRLSNRRLDAIALLWLVAVLLSLAPDARAQSVTYEETQSGGSQGSLAVATSLNLTAGSGDLYLAAVSAKPNRSVVSVTGLGLTWVPVAAQCGGRSQTGVEIWAAQGVPSGGGVVSATLLSAPLSAVISVSRYSGVDPTQPIGTMTSSNTLGIAGPCSGGLDSAGYNFALSSSTANSTIYGAVAMRNRTHTSGVGSTERSEFAEGSGGGMASVAIFDQEIGAAAPVAVDGSFNKNVDWAVIALEILSAGSSAPAPQITVTPPSHSYGSVILGESADQTFLVANDGTLDLSVGAPLVPGKPSAEFAVVSGGAPTILPPGAQHPIVVRFTPSLLGPASSSLLITSDDPETPSLVVPLSGQGISIEPDLSVTPRSGDFGDVIVSQSAGVAFTIENVGLASLVVSSTALTGIDATDFMIDSGAAPFTLPPGGTRNLLISFHPTATGAVSANLEIASNDPGEPLVIAPLSGLGIDTPPVPTGEVLHEQTVVGGSAASSTATTTSSLAAVTGDLYLAAITSKPHREVSFVEGLGLAWFPIESQCAGRSQTGISVWGAFGVPTAPGPVTATLANSSNNLAVAVSRYSGVDATLPLGNTGRANTNGIFGVCSGGSDSSAYSLTLPTRSGTVAYAAVAMRNRTHLPGGGFVERVELAQGSGGDAASLVVQDGSVDSSSVAIDGSFSSTVDWAVVALEIFPAGSSTPVPDVSVDPTAYDFGAVLLGSSAAKVFEIQNDGNEELFVDAMTLEGSAAGEFQILSGGAPLLLTPGETRSVLVSFDPGSLGTKSALLRIGSNDPDENPLDVGLSGNAVAALEPDVVVEPTSHDFGATMIASTRSTTIAIGNDGLASLAVVASELTGPDAAFFSLDAGGAPFTLAPGEFLDLQVCFSPTVEGARTATLEIVTDDPDEPLVEVLLTGVGTVAPEGIWISASELASKPMSGPAWSEVLAAADGSLGSPNVSDYNSNHDVRTLAVALVYARTGTASYRQKARDAILSAIGTESGTSQAVQPCRNVVSYVIAADLIQLGDFDPAADLQFRNWIDPIRFVEWPDGSMIEEDMERANNHGRMCGMSRAAIAVYLGDQAELDQTATVFAGFLGDTAAYNGFLWLHDTSWQVDETNPVGINPVGAVKQGLSIDGALPEEMRRGGSFQIPPVPTGYPWEALQGILVEAVILDRAGYDVFQWSDQAILRVVEFVESLDTMYPDEDWWAHGDDTWSPWVINAVYGTAFPTDPANIGKCMGWTDWTHAP